jgi:anthranilate phosphoribosyltransferase
MALYCAGISDDISECLRIAEESIITGAALNKLNELKSFSSAV